MPASSWCLHYGAMPASLSDLIALYRSKANGRYGLTHVTQMQHALQAAGMARCMGLTPEVTAACLLHDVGHLIHELGEDPSKEGIDDHHEGLGAVWLSALFPPTVTGPIALHVQAKRWLCATERGYQALLSEDSVRSLKLQGGPMPAEEAATFLARPHAPAAVALRRVDDRAKDPKAKAPLFDEFMPLLVRLSNVRTSSKGVRAVA
jgi:phosphonate degradation associated HDIG domain protein